MLNQGDGAAIIGSMGTEEYPEGLNAPRNAVFNTCILTHFICTDYLYVQFIYLLIYYLSVLDRIVLFINLWVSSVDFEIVHTDVKYFSIYLTETKDENK